MTDIPLDPVWVETTGDRDRTTSLRDLGKTDFFTRELDQLLLHRYIDAAIHSAKDLPDPLPAGLQLAALTSCINPHDSLVLRPGETLHPRFVIATSSTRREELVRSLCPDVQFIDLRGTIEERLTKLSDYSADGVVIAEAALIRLGLTHLNRVLLPGETTPLQGRLAIVVRREDARTAQLFAAIHAP